VTVITAPHVMWSVVSASVQLDGQVPVVVTNVQLVTSDPIVRWCVSVTMELRAIWSLGVATVLLDGMASTANCVCIPLVSSLHECV